MVLFLVWQQIVICSFTQIWQTVAWTNHHFFDNWDQTVICQINILWYLHKIIVYNVHLHVSYVWLPWKTVQNTSTEPSGQLELAVENFSVKLNSSTVTLSISSWKLLLLRPFEMNIPANHLLHDQHAHLMSRHVIVGSITITLSSLP